MGGAQPLVEHRISGGRALPRVVGGAGGSRIAVRGQFLAVGSAYSQPRCARHLIPAANRGCRDLGERSTDRSLAELRWHLGHALQRRALAAACRTDRVAAGAPATRVWRHFRGSEVAVEPGAGSAASLAGARDAMRIQLLGYRRRLLERAESLAAGSPVPSRS